MFDIFRGQPETGSLWVESAETFDDAKARVEQLARQEPGRYFIWDRSATQVVIRIDTTSRSKGAAN